MPKMMLAALLAMADQSARDMGFSSFEEAFEVLGPILEPEKKEGTEPKPDPLDEDPSCSS